MYWLKVNKSLPAIGLKVLVKNNGLINVASLELDGWLLEVKTITDCTDNTLIYLYHVTHWMHLNVPVSESKYKNLFKKSLNSLKVLREGIF